MKTTLFIITVLLSSQLTGQNGKLNELMKDIYIVNKDSNSATTVHTFWFPIIYWDIVLEGYQGYDEEFKMKLHKDFENYLLIGLFESIDTLGTQLYSSKIDLINKTIIINSTNDTLNRIELNELPFETYKRVLDFKNSLRNLFGELGSNIYLFAYDISGQKNLFDPSKEGDFSIIVDDFTSNYTFPFSAFLPKKLCPVTKKEYNGSWNYCPIHGEKLLENTQSSEN